MKAYWKRAYSLYTQYSKQVDVTTAMTDYSKRSLDGPLKDSAIARLLVDGKLPPDGAPHFSADDPMDLSSKSRLLSGSSPHTLQNVIKSEPVDGDRFHEVSVEMLRINMNNEMERLKRGLGSEESSSSWKCRYCPYMAPTSTILYSHYQFHQQLLTSQSSRPHIEWLTAYRKAKESEQVSEGESSGKVPMFSYPPNGMPAAHPGSPFSLRNLLGNKNDNQHSASGFLRSIVQAVMQQGDAPGPSSSSIYASLVSGKEEPCAQAPPEKIRQTGQDEPAKEASQVVEGGEIKRKGSKRKATAPSSPAVMAKYPMNPDGERRASESSCTASDADSLPGNVDEVARSPSVASTASRSYTSSPISIGKGDISSNYAPRVANVVREQRDETLSCKYPDTDINKSQFHSPSDFQRTSISPALSWSDAESDQARQITQGNRRSLKRNHKRRISTDSDVSNGSSVSKENNSYKEHVHTGLQVSSPDIRGTTLYQFPVPANDINVRSQNITTKSTETNRFDFTNMSKNYDSAPGDSLKDELQQLGDAVCGHQAVQCELLIPPGGADSNRPRYVLEDGSSSGEESLEVLAFGERTKGVIKCEHCGISFEDEVLHSIHMGCHSHTDPFSCNVCGRACGNRYGFYTHIMRGHHP